MRVAFRWSRGGVLIWFQDYLVFDDGVVVVVVERLVTGDAMFPFWVSDIPITNGYLEVSHVQDSPGRL